MTFWANTRPAKSKSNERQFQWNKIHRHTFINQSSKRIEMIKQLEARNLSIINILSHSPYLDGRWGIVVVVVNVIRLKHTNDCDDDDDNQLLNEMTTLKPTSSVRWKFQLQWIVDAVLSAAAAVAVDAVAIWALWRECAVERHYEYARRKNHIVKCCKTNSSNCDVIMSMRVLYGSEQWSLTVFVECARVCASVCYVPETIILHLSKTPTFKENQLDVE